MTNFLKKSLDLLEKLSSKPRIDGLEITNGAIKYAYFEDGHPKTVAVKLPPGIIVAGKLVDQAQFAEVLAALKALLFPERKRKTFRVNVVLPTELVFTQGFSVPNLNPGELEESIGLNLQMISPIPEEEANMSAQIISEHDFNYDFFGVFTEKKEVDRYQVSLANAGFRPVSFEFEALSLTRFIRKNALAGKNLTLVFELSSDGLELFLLKNGNVSFSYFRSWLSVQGAQTSIPREVFDRTIAEEMQKVLNFSSGKFGTSPDGVLFLAPGFEAEMGKIIGERFSLKASPITSPSADVRPAFYSTIGAALKWLDGDETDSLRSINLGGEDLSRAIYEEQIINFVSLWRGILGGVLALIFLAYIGGALFTVNQYQSVSANVANFKPPLNEGQLSDLIAKADTFNAMVSQFRSIEESSRDFYSPLKHLADLAKTGGVAIQSIGISSLTSPITISANAPSYSAVLQFKDTVSADPAFASIDLPLTQIITQGNNSVNFSMTLLFSQKQS